MKKAILSTIMVLGLLLLITDLNSGIQLLDHGADFRPR